MTHLKKTILFIGIFIATINLSYGQTETKAKEISNAEKFSDKAGTLIQKEFVDVNDIRPLAKFRYV